MRLLGDDVRQEDKERQSRAILVPLLR